MRIELATLKSMMVDRTYTMEPLQQLKWSESFWMGEYIRAPKCWHPQNDTEALGTLYYHTLTRLLSPLTVLVLHYIKQSRRRKVPA